MTTFDPTRDYLSELVKRVEREAKKRPPVQHLEGPGFVMVGRPYNPPPKPQYFSWAECAQIALIGVLITAFGFALAIFLTQPSIANP